MRVHWTENAVEHLANIYGYTGSEDKQAILAFIGGLIMRNQAKKLIY